MLLDKYKNECIILQENKNLKFDDFKIITTIKFDISDNKPDNKINVNRIDNIESVATDLLQCIKKGIKIIVIPFGFKIANKSSHANLLIYRPFEKKIERFEPHGSKTDDNVNTDDAINNAVKNYFEIEMKPYLKEHTPKFYNAEEVCPNRQGFQGLENQINGLFHKTEGGGFCSLWSIFMLELILRNPTLTTSEVINKSLAITKNDPKYVKNIIYGYVVNIAKDLNAYLEFHKHPEKFDYKKSKKALHSFGYNIYSSNFIIHALLKLNTDDYKHSLTGKKEIKGGSFKKQDVKICKCKGKSKCGGVKL